MNTSLKSLLKLSILITFIATVGAIGCNGCGGSSETGDQGEDTDISGTEDQNLPVTCTSDNDCQEGFFCQTQVCTKLSDDNSDVNSGEDGGGGPAPVVNTCLSDSECENGYRCDSTSGACMVANDLQKTLTGSVGLGLLKGYLESTILEFSNTIKSNGVVNVPVSDKAINVVSGVANITAPKASLAFGGASSTSQMKPHFDTIGANIFKPGDVEISISYNGPETINECKVNIPFNSLACDYSTKVLHLDFPYLLETFMDNWTDEFSVSLFADGYDAKVSNKLLVKKYKQTQISNFQTVKESSQFQDLSAYGDSLYFWQGLLQPSYQNFKYTPASNSITKISPVGHYQFGAILNGIAYLYHWTNVVYEFDSSANNLTRLTSGVPISSCTVVYKGSPYCETNSKELYRYDRNNSQFVQVTNMNTRISPVIADEDYLYFVTTEPCKLYRYNNVNNEIILISNTNPGGNDFPAYFTFYNNALYFMATTKKDGAGIDVIKLFQYDPSQNKTTQISNICPNQTDEPQYLTMYNGELFFRASNCNGTRGLYKYNSSDNKITKFSPIEDPMNFTVYHNELYFTGTTLEPDGKFKVSKLFKYDGTHVSLMSRTTNPAKHDWPTGLVVFKDALYFIANTDNGYRELFKLEGPNI